eukprot:TRINITY_DN17547_c0_g1_i1.p1 TRINITY_DN17547_c0_g1~~TRINITY_DN17547_c0_g1_i1.p1  ORF type:complete len:237 (-),score=41.09 TRINITY_DN17547_c0_g1_i1:181-867(-)
MMGASIHQVSKLEYVSVGSVQLCHILSKQLKQQGLNPYIIPVGGSNSLGTWGYIQTANEIMQYSEQSGLVFDDIVMACGSGGTTGGLALGMHLGGYGAQVVGYGVCDDENYFYNYIDELYEGLGVSKDTSSRQLFKAVQAKGSGYAISTQDELKYVMEVSMNTGVLLDPVYSGKALYYMMKEAEEGKWEGQRKVLFLHTGGLLGMFDKEQQLLELLKPYNKVSKMNIN